MPKKYRVTLSTDERAELEGLLARGKATFAGSSTPKSYSRPMRPTTGQPGATSASLMPSMPGPQPWSASASALSRRG